MAGPGGGCGWGGGGALIPFKDFSSTSKHVKAFSPTRPHWAELVIESPCPFAPSSAVFS